MPTTWNVDPEAVLILGTLGLLVMLGIGGGVYMIVHRPVQAQWRLAVGIVIIVLACVLLVPTVILAGCACA